MATQKPISTISYNSKEFLKEKLDTWVKAHIIQSYMYICHKGEDGDKDHIHVRIEPNKKLDPMDLTEELREYPIGCKKPLGVRPWRPSKEEDWILYAVHDKRYLDLKYGGGEKGEKLPYKMEDIIVPEDYDIEIAFIRAKAYLEHTSGNIAAKIQQGENPISLIQKGENVYIVNALVRAMQKSDYERIAKENAELRWQLEQLENAIESYGLYIDFDEDGNVVLRENS
jgi:hypothetical protein